MAAQVVDSVVGIARELTKFIVYGGWLFPIMLIMAWPMPEDERKAEKIAVRILCWSLAVVCALAFIGFALPAMLSHIL